MTRLCFVIVITSISTIGSGMGAHAQGSLEELSVYEKSIREIVEFRGKCRLDTIGKFQPCSESVVYVLSAKGTASLTFSQENNMFVLTGRGDRQFDLENYYQTVSVLTEWKNSKPGRHIDGLEGFCHFKLNSDATVFYSIKCTVNDPRNDDIYRFFLEEISGFTRE